MARCYLACLVALTLATACKKSDDAPEPPATDPKVQPAAPGAVDVDKRCLELGRVCGDTSKHVDKLVEECKQVMKLPACAAKLVAAYDCYERELCAKTDKVWALDDLGVLAERHHKCVVERDAARDCKK